MIPFTPPPLKIDLSVNGTPIGTITVDPPTKRNIDEATQAIVAAIDTAQVSGLAPDL